MAKVNDTNVLHHIVNGIEFFTLKDSGESGMSYSGLAIICGIGQSAITKLVSNLIPRENIETLECLSAKDSNPIPKKPPKRLERFLGKDLHLSQNYRKKGGSVKILKAEFCAAVIKHYAFEGSELAEEALDNFAEIGVTSWIQSKTGWLPEQYQSSQTSRDSLNRILDNPQPWSLTFDSEFEKHLERLSGLHKNDIRNGKLYWELIYNWMTPEEKRKLDQVNPVMANGRRKYCIHQMLEPGTKARLAPHISKVLTLMISSMNLEELRIHLDRQHGKYHITLFDHMMKIIGSAA